MEYCVRLSYKINNEVIKLDNINQKTFTNEHLSLSVSESKTKTSNHYQLAISPKIKIELIYCHMVKNIEYQKNDMIFVNGYQSWTDTKEFSLNEKMHSIDRLPKFILNGFCFKSYGDAHFKKYSHRKGVFHGFTYSYIRHDSNFHLWGSLNDFNAYTILNFNVNESLMYIESDIEGLIIDKDFMLLDFLEINGTEDKVFDEWKKALNLPAPRVEPTNGFCSWYNYYQNINEDIILQNLDEIAKAGHKLFQIDDGYQTYVGDFTSIDAKKFPHGLKPIVDKIHEKGMKAGVWMAPISCESKSEIAKNHPDWLVKDGNGNPIYAGCNWSKFYGLDIYNKEVQEHIKKILKFMVVDNGFDFLKLDFLYSASLAHRHDKTRAQVMRDTMQFIRDNSYGAEILGCGVQLISAAGLVDYCRIGCDVSLKFNDVWYMKFMLRERVSTMNTLQSTISRRHIDKCFFLNDPDVYLLRDENMHMSIEQRKSLALINHIFGSLYLTSDNLINYSDEKKEFAKECEKFKDYKYSNVRRVKNLYLFDLSKGKEKYHFEYNTKKGILKYGKI